MVWTYLVDSAGKTGVEYGCHFEYRIGFADGSGSVLKQAAGRWWQGGEFKKKAIGCRGYLRG